MYKEYKWADRGVDSTRFLFSKIKGSLTHERNKCLLDMGCGNGEMANKLIEEGFRVYGVDGSESGVEIANRYHKGHFFVMDFEKDELPEALRTFQFDTIISTEVIEHLYSPDSYIKLCKKVLKWGGTILISTPYHGYWKNLLISLLGKWDAHFSPEWEGGHIKFWSRKSLTELLRSNGIVVEKFIGCGRFPFLWKSMLIIARWQGDDEEKLKMRVDE